jgi:hypothetical protein
MFECPLCGESFPVLHAPPLVVIPRSFVPGYEDGDGQVEWHVPGQGFPGKETFIVHKELEDELVAEHWENAGEPICWRCWAGHVWPALALHLHNKPRQLQLNGYRKPEWTE